MAPAPDRFTMRVEEDRFELAQSMTFQQLRKAQAQPFDSERLRDQVWVASFFFTNCPAVCWRMNQTLAAIGVRIRGARIARAMTLQALADVSGLSPSMLSLVERGRASPSIGSLIVIASALGVGMSDLIVDDSNTAENAVVRPADQRVIETAQHVVRRLLREDRARAVSVAINEYAPKTASAPAL